jgi:hypothetical protein
MRLKAVRDGLEDYEYLSLIEERAGRQSATVLTQSIALDFTSWSRDVEALRDIRDAIAQAIESQP